MLGHAEPEHAVGAGCGRAGLHHRAPRVDVEGRGGGGEDDETGQELRCSARHGCCSHSTTSCRHSTVCNVIIVLPGPLIPVICCRPANPILRFLQRRGAAAGGPDIRTCKQSCFHSRLLTVPGSHKPARGRGCPALFSFQITFRTSLQGCATIFTAYPISFLHVIYSAGDQGNFYSSAVSPAI